MFALVLLASLIPPTPPPAALSVMDANGVARHPLNLGSAKAETEVARRNRGGGQ